MPAVFISHTTADHRDLDLAHRLADALRQFGATVWIAPDVIAPARSWEREIVAALLEKCSHLLVIIAVIHAGLKADRTFAFLDAAFEERHPYLTLLKVEPVFDWLRADPRFAALEQRIGLVR